MEYGEILKNLKARHFLPQLCSTAAEAKAAALAIIGSSSVGIGGSATVRDLGLYDALTAQGNEVHWHWKAEKADMPAERDAAIRSDVYLCSANAILRDGRIVNIDGTGNRVTGLIYGPPVSIVIAGRNKLADDFDSGIERIKRECCPGNARRLGLDAPCAKTGRCADCRTMARMCNVVTIHEWPTRGCREFHVLLVDEDLGL